MSWECDPLWAKSKLFFERALAESREEPIFGLWCSLGLELLARSAISSISPTLLAEPDNEHKYLLHALNLGSDRIPRKSISSIQVLFLSKTLFPQFTEDDYTCAKAMINRRNEELHTGSASFEEYKTTTWLAAFYKCCKSFCDVLGENLVSLFGEEEAKIAEEMIAVNRNDVRQRVASLVAAHKKVFERKGQSEQDNLREKAEKRGNEQAAKRHHRVICPACGCVSTVQGNAFGKEIVTSDKEKVVVRQAVAPILFECQACGLRLTGYAELEAASIGGQYTRRTTYTPSEFYGLIDEADLDDYVQNGIDEYVRNEADRYPEYDNEQ